MEKRTALKKLGFKIENNRATKRLNSMYTMCCDLGKPGFRVIVDAPGQEKKQVLKAGQVTDAVMRGLVMEIAEDFQGLLAEPEPEEEKPDKAALDNLKESGFENVQDAEYEEVPPEQEAAKPEPEKKPEPETKTETLRAKAHATPTPLPKPRRIIGGKPGRTIKGLTPRLGECGKIKIGGKGKETLSKYGKKMRLPEKYDHFVITGMAKDENDDFIPDPVIMGILGEKPTVIPVRLPYDDPSLNFPTSYARYETAACQCRGDGELAVTAEGETIECNPETCPHHGKTCKATGVLSVMLDDAPTVGGVYKFRTVGWNSINNLTASMEFIRGLTNGILAGIPLYLTLTPKYTTIPGTGKRTIIYMVNLVYRGNFEAMKQAIRATLETRKEMKYSIEDFEKLALAEQNAPEDPEEAKDIQEEFYPETAGAIPA